MRSCPTCHRQYLDDSLGFCLDDGTRLAEPLDSAATWVSPPRRDTDPGADDSEVTVVASRRQPVSAPTMVAPSVSTTQHEPFPNPSYTPPPEPPKPGRGPWMWIALALGLVLLLGLGVIGVAAVVYFNQWNEPVANSSPKPSPKASVTPSPTPVPTVTPTPEVAMSFSGTWSGDWTNSNGDSGRSTITINDNGDGTISGSEGDNFVMSNGRRSGNTLTWDYVGAGDACIDYKCVFVVDPASMTARGSFTATDSCQDTSFTGAYVQYSLDSSD